MFFADRLTLDQPRRTADGYMAVRARASRSGVYQYLGREIDPSGSKFAADEVVNVFRPEEEVFSEKAVASFLMKPVTDDHPAEPVTADNWKQHAKGVVGKALRDGEHLAFDLVLMDAGLIEAVESGKRELSNGYGIDISFEDGTAPDGTRYKAVQRNIRGNHVAVVNKGRAGPTCRIGDAATCEPIPSREVQKLLGDERTYNPAGETDTNMGNARRETTDPGEGGAPLQDGETIVSTKTILVDGLQVEVTDAAEAAITKLQGTISDAVAAKDKAEADLAAVQTEVAAKDTEIATLKQQLEDAKITPNQFREAAKAFAQVCDKAKALGVEISDDFGTEEVMKAVVDAKMGETAKDWTPEQIKASFAVLTKDTKADPLREGIRDNKAVTADSQIHDAYNGMVEHLTNAWKPKQAA